MQNPVPATISNTRVFVVDDHPVLRYGIETLINAQGDMVVCGQAANTADTLAAIRDANPDVVLLDIALNGENGIDLLKYVKTLLPNVKALMLSMHGETVLAERALTAGAAGYVLKEEATETVLPAIRQACAGNVYISPGVASSLYRHAHSPLIFNEPQSFSSRNNGDSLHMNRENYADSELAS